MNENFSRTIVDGDILRECLERAIGNYCVCKGIDYFLKIISILVQMIIQGEGFYVPVYSGCKLRGSFRLIDHTQEYRLFPIFGSENLCYMAFLSKEDLLNCFPMASYAYLSLAEICRDLVKARECDNAGFCYDPIDILCIKTSFGDELYLWDSDILTIFNIVLQVVNGFGIGS